MNYNHYRTGAPGWGTNQFRFGPPPAPNFQPQPSWGGMDYYRAHAINPDVSLYNHAWNRLRDYPDAAGSLGVGLHEARHWHRRAYGGLGELNQMLPEEIGHAAAYEAHRTWMHNSSIHEPLSGDWDRQREGLIGLAVAEATRLLQYTSRSMDQYARIPASDAAAATASIIFYESRDNIGDEYHSRSRSRRGSFSSSYDDPYAFDNALDYPRHRSQSRHRSHSRHRAPSVIVRPSSAIPMPGAGVPYGGYAGSYGSQYGGSVPMPIQGAHSYGSLGVPGSYHGSSLGVPGMQSMRHRSASFSAPFAQGGYAGSGGMPPLVGAPQTVVLSSSSGHKRHKHRHSHSHGHHHRSRSIEPGYGGYSVSNRF